MIMERWVLVTLLVAELLTEQQPYENHWSAENSRT